MPLTVLSIPKRWRFAVDRRSTALPNPAFKCRCLNTPRPQRSGLFNTHPTKSSCRVRVPRLGSQAKPRVERERHGLPFGTNRSTRP